MKNPSSREKGFSESKGYWDLLYLFFVISADLNRRCSPHQFDTNALLIDDYGYALSYVYDSLDSF